LRRLPNEWWFNATNSTNEEAFNKIIEEPAIKAIREIGEITKKISLNVIHFSKEICFKSKLPFQFPDNSKNKLLFSVHKYVCSGYITEKK